MASTLHGLGLGQLTKLAPADRATVAAQLRSILATLPPDDGSSQDVAVRERLKMFLAGFELGSLTESAES